MKRNRPVGELGRVGGGNHRPGPIPAHGREEQTIMEICGLIGVALLGFLAGLFSFRVKSRWCPTCGGPTTTSPPH
nr:hypothetical protein [Micromonospora sp. DSM 115978]